MLDTFRLVLQEPMQAVVATLCAVTVSLFLGFVGVREDIAVMSEQQKVDILMNEKVMAMSDTLIRIDENVKILKDKVRDIK